MGYENCKDKFVVSEIFLFGNFHSKSRRLNMGNRCPLLFKKKNIILVRMFGWAALRSQDPR